MSKLFDNCIKFLDENFPNQEIGPPVAYFFTHEGEIASDVTGERRVYQVIRSGRHADIETALLDWFSDILRYLMFHANAKIYWRIRPETTQDEQGHWAVYSRLVCVPNAEPDTV
jgi:hypothetical protein